MLKWIIIAALAVGVWQWWGKAAVQQYQAQQGNRFDIPKNSARFRCDGRTHCSQMTSCEEATFFLQHCPNTKMDGNRDGVPCEKQWCQR